MRPFLLSAAGRTLDVVPSVGAVHVPVIAVAAKVEQPPAGIVDALNLPEIVHSRVRPPGIRPLRGSRATTLSSNASTRGDPGLGASDSGPYSLLTVAGIVRRRPSRGQLHRQAKRFAGNPGLAG